MDSSFFKSLLQLQLASDSSAVLHLPYVLEQLTRELISSASDLQRLVSRVNSLIHSKNAAARWAGLCIAYKTSYLSKTILLEHAQTWVGLVLPLLSKNESLPVVKMSIRLLRHILSAATDVPEFQRQLAIPNVPKFSLSLINMIETEATMELQERFIRNIKKTILADVCAQILAIDTLIRLVPLYPTLHRGLHAQLSSITLRLLNGSAPRPSDNDILRAASRLYCTLHVVGGKVGAITLWRKSMDETLAFSWTAFLGLRTTFPDKNYPQSHEKHSVNEPLTSIPLNLDRLKCGAVVICDMLRAQTQRPAQMPIGALISFIMALLRCTMDAKDDGYADVGNRSMELAAVPSIWKIACNLVISLAETMRQYLTAHVFELMALLAYHLEQPLSPELRVQFLGTVRALVTGCHYFDSQMLASRLARAILPSLTVILSANSITSASSDPHQAAAGTKKGKKRRRGYEGDEIFKTSKVLCPQQEDEDVVLAALDALQIILLSAPLAPSIRSLSSRVLLSMCLSLPVLSPTSLSPNLHFHEELLSKVRELCTRLAHGTTSAMSQSLSLVLRSIVSDGASHKLNFKGDLQCNIDILLHPRGPPMVRSLPHVESLSLFCAEESTEEISIRDSLRLRVNDNDAGPQDDEDTTAAAINSTHVQQLVPNPPVSDVARKPALTSSTPVVPSGPIQVSSPNAPHSAGLSQLDADQQEVEAMIPSTPRTPSLGFTRNTITSQWKDIPAATRKPNEKPVNDLKSASAAHIVLIEHDDDGDEEMPVINMDSDSD